MNLKGGEQSPPFLFITQFRLELKLFVRQQMTATSLSGRLQPLRHSNVVSVMFTDHQWQYKVDSFKSKLDIYQLFIHYA